MSAQFQVVPEQSQHMTPTVTRLSFTVALGGMTLNYELAENATTTPEGVSDAVRRVVAVLTGQVEVPQPPPMSAAEVAEAACKAVEQWASTTKTTS